MDATDRERIGRCPSVSGAAVRRAKLLEQFLDFRRTDHPGRTALATGRCSFFVD